MRTTDLFDLDGKVVVVTGGNGLLGSSYCRALADQGAAVVMADLPVADPVQAASRLTDATGRPCLGLTCDVGVEADVISLFEHTMDHFGRVDAVLNNAAATGEHLMRQGEVFARFEDYPLEVWEAVIRTNLTGVFLVAREGGKAMLAGGGGSLVNVSSTYGVVGPDHRIYVDMPFSSFAAYSASKAGVHGITRWLATYWGGQGIRVNTLVPGGVENQHDPEFIRRYSSRTPLGRMASPKDMVGMVVFLVSDASGYATGQQFFIDGGWTAW